jgi:AbrB family looped-hinge helix DNA binding protein
MPRVTAKGQVTIPVTVRYALGIAPGDDVVFAVEGGRGVFRRADGATGRAGALGLTARPGAHPLERLLCAGDADFEDRIRVGRAGEERVRIADVVILDIGRWAVAGGAAPHDVAEALRDVCADRGILLDHARAVRAAVDALGEGRDPGDAYALARA